MTSGSPGNHVASTYPLDTGPGGYEFVLCLFGEEFWGDLREKMGKDWEQRDANQSGPSGWLFQLQVRLSGKTE